MTPLPADRKARDLDAEIATLYCGPFDEFVSRRAALARDLRSAGERESAAVVKGLRKPSRLAWTLNLGRRDDPEAFAALETAVAGTLEAHSGGVDVRGAMASLREAIRGLADRSSDAAGRAGYRVDSGAIGNAVLAVLGRPESFDQLRNGRLVEVPEAGGLDFLTSLPALPITVTVRRPETPKAARARGEPATAAAPGERASPPPGDAPGPSPEEVAAREHARRTAERLTAARDRVEAAEEVLEAVRADLTAAQERLRVAEREVAALEQRHEVATREAEAATSELRSAELTNTDAQRLLEELRD